MKVITSGSENRRVVCCKCRCEFEFDEEDVQKYDLREDAFSFFIPSTEDSLIEFVECPECGGVNILRRQPKKNEIREDGYTIRALS